MAKSGGGGSSELKIFEALESYTMNDSFSSKASFVQTFLQCDLDLNNTQQSLQVEEEDDDDILEEVSESEDESSSTSTDGTSYISVCSDGEDFGHGVGKASGVKNFNGVDKGSSNDSLRERGTRAAMLSLLLKRHTHKENDKSEEKDVVVGTELSQVEEEDEEEVEVSQVLEEEGSEGEEEENDKEDERSKGDEAVSYPGTAGASVGVENWTQYFQLLELKRSLEEKQEQMEKEKESFSKIKTSEENRMKAEKKRVESQKKNLQNLITDYHKVKFSKEEYEEKIKQLGDQLKETKLQMNKRFSRWSDQQRRLEERVKTLEKENEELKKSQSRSIPERLAALKRPPMRCTTNKKQKPPQQNYPPPQQQRHQQRERRVQFADECNPHEKGDDTKENEAPQTSHNSSASSSSTPPGKTTHSPEVSTVSPVATSEEEKGDQSTKEISLSDDEADKTMPSDYVEIKHSCGTITRITKDSKLTRHVLINKDVMDEFEDASVRYYYHDLRFAQTTYPNGDEIIEYDSGEIEMKRADGSKIYTYSDGLVKMVDGMSGAEEVIFSDGSVVKKTADGECTITWPSGQKEVRTANYVKRIYTNGTVKIMYQDGSEETRYFNGRVRRKDKNGVLVDDTKKPKPIKT